METHLFYIFIMKNFFVKYILWWRSIFYKSYHIFILINSLYYEIFGSSPQRVLDKRGFFSCHHVGKSLIY
ncbi:hypothetical protein GTCCBUS3UF5_1720 [Geobacillus thermoleovorans CCB_US3_UF5]|uniref:Uncharacterized protein n=1 Tax=Geobacillus thermoleovorans CCB_US3_UF5 TaxID=1111068 RepID=A0ABM5MD07_GEOTH|nr:hypothetical protein GTCCBUS3UF5_1720 [Geobacillus thermoleovorans CCB_US3_UF5]